MQSLRERQVVPADNHSLNVQVQAHICEQVQVQVQTKEEEEEEVRYNFSHST